MNLHVNGIDLFYKQSGTGSPLLLLHGNGEDHRIFNELTKKLAENFTVYAIDSRNHGKSAQTKDFSYDTMCADVNAFMQALDLRDVSLVGFSDGGIIGLLLAIDRHPRLKKMAVLGPNLSPTDFTADSLAYIKEEYITNNDPLFKLMLEQPNIPLDTLTNITIPMLVIGAEHDIFQPELFPKLATTIPNAQLLIVEGHDHGSYIIDNDLLADALLTFFTLNNRIR